MQVMIFRVRKISILGKMPAIHYSQKIIINRESTFSWDYFLILPNPTRVILRPRYNRIPLIVESAAENLILVTQRITHTSPSKTCNSVPLSAFQMRQVLSELAVMILEPCELKLTFEISPECPIDQSSILPKRIAIQFPVNTLYTRDMPSAPAVAKRFPVLLKQASRTSSLWPLKVSMHFPLVLSHSLQVLIVKWNLPINRPSHTVISCKIELSAGQLACMSTQSLHACSIPDIPYLIESEPTLAVVSNEPVRILSPSVLK